MLNKEFCDKKDVFILDQGYEITVWVGLDASYDERRFALKYAEKYLEKYERPLHLPINRMLEGGENETFEEFFE